jgi:hypothetical protein
MASDYFKVISGNKTIPATIRPGSATKTSVVVEASFVAVNASDPDILVIRNILVDGEQVDQIITTWTFQSASDGYAADDVAEEFKVLNNSTGPLTVTLGATGRFQVSPTSLSLEAGETKTIKVGPQGSLPAGENYEGALTINGSNITPVNMPLKIRVTGLKYVITQLDPEDMKYYVATRGTDPEPFKTGTISDVLSEIRADTTRGSAAVLQFGVAPEDVVKFNVAIPFEDNGSAWGNVELQGKILSYNNDGQQGAVVVGENVALTNFADIESQGSGDSNVIFSKSTKEVTIEGGMLLAKLGRVIYNSSSGKVTVKNGTVRSLVVDAILNNADGDVEVAGGTVEAMVGRAIQNSYTGTVTVKNNGIVRAWGTNGVAIRNAVTSSDGTVAGKVYVEGGTVTSENAVPDQGTILLLTYNEDPESEEVEDVETLLTITGGKVANTVIAGKAIYNNTTGRVLIKDGRVEALKSEGVAIFNRTKGPLEISGGTIAAEEGVAIRNDFRGKITISGGEVKATTGRAIWSREPARGSAVEEGALSETDNYVMMNVMGGRITSSNPSDTQGTIHIEAARAYTDVNEGIDTGTTQFIRLVISGDDTVVENTSPLTGNAIFNDSRDNVYVESGSVKACGGNAIDNLQVGGRVKIFGGTVFVTDGKAINNRKDVAVISGVYQSSVEITGGTVEAVDGVAVWNVENGLITIKGNDTVVTSANTKGGQGTIFLARKNTPDGLAYTDADILLLIEGGLVENTSVGNAIYNASDRKVKITGVNAEEAEAREPPETESYPIVRAISGSAVFNNNSGLLEITNGSTVEVESGIAVNNITSLVGSTLDIVTISDYAAEDDEISDDEYFAAEHRTVVRATSGKAVYTGGDRVTATGKFNVVISGGIVSTESGYAVDKAGGASSALNTGATVSIQTVGSPSARTRIIATEKNGVAINIGTQGMVTIGGKTLVTSKNQTVNQGTIIVADHGPVNITAFSADPIISRLSILGGKVVNDGGGVAIWNRSRGMVFVNGPTAQVISNNSSATQGTIVLAKISDATVASYPLAILEGNVYNGAVGGNAIYNASIATVLIGDKSDAARDKLVVISEDDEENPYGGGIWVHVDQESAIAVNNLDNGIIDIQGGTIEATGRDSNKAVNNNAGGLIKISNFGLNTTARGTLVRVTGSSSYAVWNNSVKFDTGTLVPSVSIDGGKVVGTTAKTVYNHANGKIEVKTGAGTIVPTNESTFNPIITATTGVAIHNNADGLISIAGGLIKGGEIENEDEDVADAKPGTAIYNASFGTVEIKSALAADYLKITSRNPSTTEGTIYFSSTIGNIKSNLIIESKSPVANIANFLIENTASEGNVILQESHGNIKIADAAAFVGRIGANKLGMGNSVAEGPNRGYALKVTDQSARDYVWISQTSPIPISPATSAILGNNIARTTNIGVVKGTNYRTWANGDIEENP